MKVTRPVSASLARRAARFASVVDSARVTTASTPGEQLRAIHGVQVLDGGALRVPDALPGRSLLAR